MLIAAPNADSTHFYISLSDEFLPSGEMDLVEATMFGDVSLSSSVAFYRR